MDDRQAAQQLRRQDKILILTHRQPDGDTVGCAAGLCRALRQLGKTAFIAPNEDIHGLFTPYVDGLLAPAEYVSSYVVAVDVAGTGMLTGSMERYIGGIDLVIDHHPSNEGFGKHNCVDAGCAACGELVYRIVRRLGPVTPEIALPLYVAVSTDTGCFVYANTTPETHRIAAALMETGIDYASANKRHFRTKSLKRLKMESMIMAGLEIFDNDIVMATVTLEMMKALDAAEQDMEDIAAFIGQVEGADTAVTVRELRPGECKISLRTGRDLNASAVCALLGGGGHAAAAGCTIYGTVERARAEILRAVRTVRNG